jgi:hypothetical protein
MKYVKSGKEYMSDINKFVSKIKSRFDDFIKKLQTEGKETKEAFDLVLKESRGELLDENGNKRDLTSEEKELVKEQAKDFFKVLGLTSITLLPGGTLVFILIRVFKQESNLLPSSFLTDEQKQKKIDKKTKDQL